MEKDEEEASKCYFRNSFCLFMSVYVRFLRRRRMRIGRRRTEKELYMRGLSVITGNLSTCLTMVNG